MRKMFLMSGPPGSGKTTFLRENGYLGHTVGLNTVRGQLSGPHPALDDGVESVTRCAGSAVESAVVRFTESAVRTRCGRGETVFVDAVRARDVMRWQRVAADFDYEVIVVDMMSESGEAELVFRNATRTPIERVSTDAIRAWFDEAESTPVNTGTGARVITADLVADELIVPSTDFRDRNRVIVIGDVQGCGTALDALIRRVEPGDRDAVVFTGDLFDRGVENDRVYRSVQALRERTDVHLVAGNHDHHLIECIKHTTPRGYAQTRASIRQLVEAGILARDLLVLYRSMVPFVTARFADDAELWISHGGVVGLEAYRVPVSEAMPVGGYRTGLLPDRLFEYGSSERDRVHAERADYITDIDAVFAHRYAGEGILSFHGHRPTPAQSGDAISFGLESSVEFDGGVLSAAVVTRGGIGTQVHRIEVPNPVTCGPRKQRPSKPGR